MILLINTLTVSTCRGIIHTSYWYSFILFIIIVGGILVLIIYITRIASNEIFENPWKFLMIVTISFILIIRPELLSLIIRANLQEISRIIRPKRNTLSLRKFINPHHISTTIILINYLFITLIAIVKITKTKYGSLRQKF